MFPECVAKGSCFLSWESGRGGLLAGRFRVAGLQSRRPAVYGESERRWCFVMPCASFVVQSSTGTSFVEQSSTGKCLVQAS